ncbi:MAG TPA: gamma carbonic anhydrase family protein [Candidatus Cybelea sp.]|jgi:carbonic anhydrase/acetyltransferase-like protein (isoleucine patch superfamily)|nr:gamma carbonic anhydrase family protein [Candidatus Cybelea sp.]
MIVSSGTKRPKIHSSAYVAPSAVVSGDVTIGAGSAVLHGAVVTAEGAPLVIGEQCVIMENAVLKASGGSAVTFPLKIGSRCIVGPQAYVVGATIGDGCFVAGGAKIFNGATLERGSGVALNGIVQVKSRLRAGESVPMQHIAFGDPATIYPPDQAPEIHAKLNFYADVFNLEPGDDVRARAAEVYAKFLRKAHAQDAPLEEHRNAKPPPRRSGEEPPQTQATQVDKVVDVMMLELEEMEHRRQQAIKRQKGG